MMKILLACCLISAFQLFNAFAVGAPLFIGATTDYITNSGGTITFVYSNRVRVVYDRGNSTTRITNNIAGQSLVLNAGTIDEGAAIRQEYSFGTSQGLTPGYIWGFTLTTNGFIMGDGVPNFFLNYTRTTGILQLPSTGVKIEGTVNLTNLPGAGDYVAIASSGLLYRTNTPAGTNINNNYFQTNTFYNQTTFKGPTTFTSVSNYFNTIVVTNGVGNAIATATRYGGALTNISLDAQGPTVIHVDGSTNVNLVAIMNWVAGLQRPFTLLITNRTATVRTVSLETTTNQWTGMGTITAPWQNTNALWIAFENLGTSNNVYAAQYIANPSN